MKRVFLSTGLRWLWLALLVVIIDLGSKFWVMEALNYYVPVQILPFFSLTYVHNIGAAFSIFAGHRWPLAVVAVVICSILIVMLYRLAKNERMLGIAYSLIIGGALGNLFDRLYHGYVIDFFHFYIMDWTVPLLNIYIADWHYPVFNVADIAICAGAGLIILDAILVTKRHHAEKRQAEQHSADSGSKE